jgi:predicted GIY-YIG superfamily endonuclease
MSTERTNLVPKPSFQDEDGKLDLCCCRNSTSVASPRSPSLKIYVLLLESNKWYVGSTRNVAQRFQEHKMGKGSTWTTIYRPVKIDRVVKNASPFDEDKITKEYMATYGIDNVRGGSYCQEILDVFQRESIQREIWMATGACFVCGRRGHFAKDCKATYDTAGRLIGEVLNKWVECRRCGKHFSSYEKVVNECNECDECVPREPKTKTSPCLDVMGRNSEPSSDLDVEFSSENSG